MKTVKMIAVLTVFILNSSSLMNAAADYSDLSSIARKYLSPTETAQQAQDNEANTSSSYLNATSLNQLINSTPDSVKEAVINKIPQEYKGYLVRFIEFIKSFFTSDKNNTATLDSIKNLLEKNMANYQAAQPAPAQSTLSAE